MSTLTKKEILDFIDKYKLPLTPTSGILAYTLRDPSKYGNLYLPTAYKKSAIRSGEVLKGVVVSEPINCEEEPLVKKGVEILYKASSGHSLNINGHLFHKLEINEILAVVDE